MRIFERLKQFRKQILRVTALVFGVALLALLAWVFYLDQKITTQFEGRRWTLPAQVYAEPTELYVGSPFTADAIERELQRLGYRKVQELKDPGTYTRNGTQVDLINRRFRFWDALQEPQKLSIVASARGIQSMRNGRGEDVPIFRLDPLLIGSIFPIHGEDRVVVAPEDVPPLLPVALKVVEDRKFDSHHGVDLGAIARAGTVNLLAGSVQQGGSPPMQPLLPVALKVAEARKFDSHHGVDLGAIARAAIVNLRAGSIQQGGSTLTQQLVKSYFLDSRRTFGRKIEEAIMAVLLEIHFEK